VTPMVRHIVHLQDVVKFHTFVLGHLGAIRFLKGQKQIRHITGVTGLGS